VTCAGTDIGDAAAGVGARGHEHRFGPAYIAAKHRMAAMRYTLNPEECANGIRSALICRARWQVEHAPSAGWERPRAGELIPYSRQAESRVRHLTHPAGEVVISRRYNRGYINAIAGAFRRSLDRFRCRLPRAQAARA
jgi:hypothetical protein